MHSTKLDIISLCEVNRAGECIVEYKEFILYYKGETWIVRSRFIIKKHIENRIEKIMESRIAIISIRLPTGKEKDEQYSIIQVYSPTEPKSNQTA